MKAFDLAQPDHLEHKGHLDLTYTHLGVYRVTVPAGSYEAAIFKWSYQGKIGPAKVDDVQ